MAAEMKPVCYHKCSKSLLPNRDVANDSDLEKNVGGRFLAPWKKNDSIPNFQQVSIVRFFPLQKSSPALSWKFPFDTLHETNISPDNGWLEDGLFSGGENVSGSVMSKSDGTKWGVFLASPSPTDHLQKGVLSFPKRHKDDTNLPDIPTAKKTFRGAKKWGAHIGLAVFFFGCFSAPEKIMP